MQVARIIPGLSLATAISGPCLGMEMSRSIGCVGGDVLRLCGDIEAGDCVRFHQSEARGCNDS